MVAEESLVFPYIKDITDSAQATQSGIKEFFISYGRVDSNEPMKVRFAHGVKEHKNLEILVS